MSCSLGPVVVDDTAVTGDGEIDAVGTVVVARGAVSLEATAGCDVAALESAIGLTGSTGAPHELTTAVTPSAAPRRRSDRRRVGFNRPPPSSLVTP